MYKHVKKQKQRSTIITNFKAVCVHQVSELHQTIWSNLYSLARDMWQSKINVMTHSAFLELEHSGKFVWNNSVWIIISVNCFVIINIQIPAPVRHQPQDNKECHTTLHPTLTKYRSHCLPFKSIFWNFKLKASTL